MSERTGSTVTVDPQPPMLRIVRGEPTTEELVALLVVVLARAAATVRPTRERPRSVWAARERQLRRPVAPGPGAWRRSGLPTA